MNYLTFMGNWGGGGEMNLNGVVGSIFSPYNSWNYGLWLLAGTYVRCPGPFQVKLIPACMLEEFKSCCTLWRLNNFISVLAVDLLCRSSLELSIQWILQWGIWRVILLSYPMSYFCYVICHSVRSVTLCIFRSSPRMSLLHCHICCKR
jgi:hypothetical protein